MKKITLLSLFVLAIATFSYAQNLKIVYETGSNHTYQNDSTIYVWGSSASSIITSPYFSIINRGDSGGYLHCKRHIYFEVPGTSDEICFAGECAPAADNTDPDSCSIAANDTAYLGNAFNGDYLPAGHNGTTTIRYTFFNDSYSDSGSFIVVYNASPTGVAEVSGQVSLSGLYPNPATSSVNISYNISNGVDAASLKIFNMLGECVQTLPLNTLKNKTTINVQGMPSGIYVCEMQD